MVGIFWLLGNRLIFDTSPLGEAEPYGDCLDHAAGHFKHWTRLQRDGVVPRDIEYDDPPRGRVIFNKTTKRFMFYADQCIRKKKSVVKEIMNAMCLPVRETDITLEGRDSHYRCRQCMESSNAREFDR
jgi:hypothetical protein